MYIKKIELVNVQRHKHLILDLTAGINGLAGKTGVGKSAIIRALIWILTNQFSSDDIRKDGTKKTVVTLTRSDGLIISRTKTDTVNRYSVIYPDGKEQVFDSIGKSIPEEVRLIFNIPIMTLDKDEFLLNIQEQHGSHFLINEKDTVKSQVLNKLTGNDLLDRIIQSINKDILAIGRDEKTQQSIIDINTDKLKSVETELDKANDIYFKVKATYDIAIALQEELNDLEEARTSLEEAKRELNNAQIELEDIEIPDVMYLNDKISQYHNILELIENKEVKENELLKAKELLNINIPTVENTLAKAIEHAEILSKLTLDLILKRGAVDSANKIKDSITAQIKGEIENYNKLIKEIPSIKCDKCGNLIKEIQYKEILDD